MNISSMMTILTMMTFRTMMTIIFVRKLEVVHKQVRGYRTRCARIAASITLNDKLLMNEWIFYVVKELLGQLRMLFKDLVSVTPGVETPEGCQKICQVKFALRELHFYFSGAELFYLSKLWVRHWGIGNTTLIPFLSEKCAFCCVFLWPENFISDTFKTTGPRQWQILSITISISDKPQARQGWYTFYSALLHRERKILACFNRFWLFCCKFMHIFMNRALVSQNWQTSGMQKSTVWAGKLN